MRLFRLVALLLGVGLVVAAGAGCLARTADLARQRDTSVRNVADSIAARVGAVADRVSIAAALATGADDAVRTLGRADVVTCAAPVVAEVVIVDAMVCGTAVAGDAVERARALLAWAEPGREAVRAEGSTVAIGAVGEAVAVASELVVDTATPRQVPIRVELAPSAEAPVGAGVHDDGDRRVAVSVPAALPGWAVVATSPEPLALPADERNLLLVLAVGGGLLLVLAGITLVAEQRRLVERASVDAVTKLPNRSELESRGEAMLGLAKRNEQGACLMLVDLDGFKTVNDELGHAVGDEVLRVVGMRLRSAVRSYDLVARWGGDEFVLVLPGIDNDTFANSRAASLASLVAQPMRAGDGGSTVGPQVGASIGIALLGRHGETLDELVAAADAAMYEAKRSGTTHAIAEDSTLGVRAHP